MCLVRLPVDRDRLHCIPLYDEVPVVVVPLEHLVTAADEITLADLADEQLVLPHAAAGPRPPRSSTSRRWSVKDAIEVVASGTGVVIVPQSVARLHHRKDVTTRPVVDLPPTRIGLAWRLDRDDEQVQAFIGIVRGRTANSSRADRWNSCHAARETLSVD